MPEKNSLKTIHSIQDVIQVVRGHRVILDSDLARLYGVETKDLNKAVNRNTDRFPHDFAFRLTSPEFADLRFQNGTSSSSHGGRRYLPFAFTEHGVIMAANVLRSPKAVEMSVMVVRAFVQMRSILSEHANLTRRLDAMEKKYDKQFKVVFDAIRELMTPPGKSGRKIGF